MIYLAIEMVSSVSAALVGYRKGDRKAGEAALKYIIYSGVASGIMLFGMSYIYGITGSTSLLGLGQALNGASASAFGVSQSALRLTLALAVIFVLSGIGYKTASVPWHMWCPDVYEGAPTPFTAFLSVGPKAAGFALAVRFFWGGLTGEPTGGVPHLLTFTCAGRGFCPTCLGRRMNQTTLNLLAHVLPAQPLRQWVVSLPFPLRAPLAYEPGLMALVARVFEDSLLRWYRRRLAPEDSTAQGGLLTVIQRSSGDMRLNPHLHVVALDGVYVAGPDGQPVFRELPRLKTSEVADVVQITKVRVLKALERRGVVRVSPASLEVDDVLSARDPVLAQLAAAAVAGLPPAGPAERKREPVLFPAGGEPEIVGELVVQDSGFNVHAKTYAGALDHEARARLLRYILRPPLAQERLAILPDHRIRLTLKRPWSDGTYAIEMQPTRQQDLFPEV